MPHLKTNVGHHGLVIRVLRAPPPWTILYHLGLFELHIKNTRISIGLDGWMARWTLQALFLQERVYPVALTEGATLLPSLLLLLIFLILSCVLLTILIIRGRWIQSFKLSMLLGPISLCSCPIKKMQKLSWSFTHSVVPGAREEEETNSSQMVNISEACNEYFSVLNN